MQNKVVKRTVAFSKDSSNLFFHILTKCNLRCKHCYINRDEHGRKTLDLATIREWLALFIERSQETNLILLGGEPTLHPDLSLVVKAARKMGFSSITIDTNGYLFHDILDKITPDDLDFISFSLDGATPATNDAIRGKGCYDACVKGVKKAVEKGFSTSMIYTVSAANIDELDQMPDLVKALGVDRFFIQVVGIRGESAGDGGRAQVTMERWLEVVPPVAREIARAGITVTWPKVFLDPDEIFECAGLVADNYFVFPNGRVYRCPLCEDYPIHGFEIRENRLVPTAFLNETALFDLTIPEGCVMNKLVQPGNITYGSNGRPERQIACCMLKQEIVPTL
ncbi:MAG: radical SAM protein [Desulfobacterium sp.]|jgi:MoaA/NifB/PqqE/SkfB family radical SAM enzyme|nr:radical SAM protein [Desulfobacterium sp.]